MKLSNRAEEALESLWIRRFEDGNGGGAGATEAAGDVLEELARAGFVEGDGDRVRLTPAGEEEGRNCVRRHRLAERLLADVLDVKKSVLRETGCEFEHLLHRGLDESICTLLGHPKTCPHGKPIPEGACCRTAMKHAERLIVPLAELDVGRAATVAYLHTRDKEALGKLIAMGVLPGVKVILRQRFPAVVFEVGRSQFAVDGELARRVNVRKDK